MSDDMGPDDRDTQIGIEEYEQEEINACIKLIAAKCNQGLIPNEKLTTYVLDLMGNPDIYTWKRYTNSKRIQNVALYQLRELLEDEEVLIQDVEAALMPTKSEELMYKMKDVLLGSKYSMPSFTVDELIDYLVDSKMVRREYVDFTLQDASTQSEKIDVMLDIIERLMTTPGGLNVFVYFANEVITQLQEVSANVKRIINGDENEDENLIIPAFEDAMEKQIPTTTLVEETIMRTRAEAGRLHEISGMTLDMLDLLTSAQEVMDKAACIREVDFQNQDHPEYTVCYMQGNKIVEIMVGEPKIKREVNDNNPAPLVLSNVMQIKLNPTKVEELQSGLFTPDAIFNIVGFKEKGKKMVQVECDNDVFWVSPRHIAEVVV